MEKYYDGETSLAEERLLKDFFTSHPVPPRLQAEKAYFASLAGEKGKTLRDPVFDESVMNKISRGHDGLLVRILARRPWFYATAGVAASILILLAIFIRFDPLPKKLQDTYSDPEVAYQEAKKVLLFVSGQLNRGTGRLQSVAAYDEGISRLKTVNALNDGVNAVGKVKKYNKIEQMIEKSN